tara:strand:+ start:274820 stop:275158 length:339 start_codon:yes stop_codon:yes gene_type:complete
MKYLIIGAALILSATQLKSQEKVKTDSLYVEGVCEMCQQRIQKHAYGKGVKFAEWNLTNSYLTVAYNTEKTTMDDISKRVAKAGHTTSKHPHDKKGYENLPNCCKYESVEKH